MYADKLTEEGYDVRVVKSGVDVIDTIQNFKPDLVFLDMILPEKMGFEILEELQHDRHKNSHKPPIIMFSNLSQEDIKQKARALGVVDFYVKMEYTPGDLAGSVKRFFSK